MYPKSKMYQNLFVLVHIYYCSHLHIIEFQKNNKGYIKIEKEMGGCNHFNVQNHRNKHGYSFLFFLRVA